jgi:hypothetical protein
MFVAEAPEVLTLVAPVIARPPVPWIRPEPELTPTAVKAPATSRVPVKLAALEIV